jgi:hypothetical protein
MDKENEVNSGKGNEVSSGKESEVNSDKDNEVSSDKTPDIVDKLFAEEFEKRIVWERGTLLERILKKSDDDYVESMKKKHKFDYDNQRDASA